MRRAAVLVLLAALGLVASIAHADGGEAEVVPTLSLSGATSGKGKISVGLDVRTSLYDSRSWETHFAPSFTVASNDGIANLLSISHDTGTSGPPDWALGLTVSAVDRHPDDALSPPDPNELFDALALCRPGPSADETAVDAAKLCARGDALLERKRAELVEKNRFPRQSWALGATYGATQITSLMGGTGPAAALSLSTTTRSNVLVGGLFTYVSPSEHVHFTFELPVIFKSSYRPPTTTAQWCVPSGTVTTSNGSGPAQICDQQPLGAPTHTSQPWAAMLFGFAAEGGRFRFAAGPTFSYDAAASTTAPYQIGFQAPLYVSFVKGVANISSDYEGIVRLVPSFALNHTDKGLVPVGTVSLELLGKRGLFGSSLYWP